MPIATPITALLIFGIIVTIAILSALFIPKGKYKGSQIETFMTILAGLSIIITFLFYYGVLELNQTQQELFTVQETARVSSLLVEELMQEIEQNADTIPNFAISLTPLQRGNLIIPPDSDTPENRLAKLFLSTKVFSVWQDVLVADKFTVNEPVSYITNFLQRANSSQLYEQWQDAKIDYNIRTQQFGDLLFEYALPIRVQTPEMYVETAEKLLKDLRYVKIRI